MALTKVGTAFVVVFTVFIVDLPRSAFDLVPSVLFRVRARASFAAAAFAASTRARSEAERSVSSRSASFLENSAAFSSRAVRRSGRTVSSIALAEVRSLSPMASS